MVHRLNWIQLRRFTAGYTPDPSRRRRSSALRRRLDPDPMNPVQEQNARLNSHLRFLIERPKSPTARGLFEFACIASRFKSDGVIPRVDEAFRQALPGLP